MSIFQTISIILSVVTILGTVVYHVFVVAKAFTLLTSSMENLSLTVTNLRESFVSTVDNLEKTFNIQLENLSENFKDMKNTQEKFAEIVNDIVIRQMRDMDKDITRVSESTKSAHHRLDCIERKNNQQ